MGLCGYSMLQPSLSFILILILVLTLSLSLSLSLSCASVMVLGRTLRLKIYGFRAGGCQDSFHFASRVFFWAFK